MITFSSSTQSAKDFASFQQLGKIIHVMTLVHPYVKQGYESSEAVAKQMGFCLDWLSDFVDRTTEDQMSAFMEKAMPEATVDYTSLDDSLIKFWARLVCGDTDLKGRDLESFVYLGGCYLGFIQQLSEQQREQGADSVSEVMDGVFVILAPLIEFADEQASEKGNLSLSPT